MTKKEAVEHFKTTTALARALGLSQSTVWEWKHIPDAHQLRVEELTQGKLRADPHISRGYAA